MLEVNKAEATANVSKGLGWTGWLTIIFVILKLNPGNNLSSDVENWSWWLVFIFPLSGIGILILFALGVGLVFAGAALLDWNSSRKHKKIIKETEGMTWAEKRTYFENKKRGKDKPNRFSR